MSDILTRAGRPTRRRFVKIVAGTAVGAIAAPAIVRGRNLNDKLNIAMIATGGRGGFNLKQAAIAAENIVVLCDVYQPAVAKAAQMYPQARRLQRLPPRLRPRQRLRRGGGQHDRAHARLRHAAGLATGQARLLREAADVQHLGGPRSSARPPPRAKVATQMGNQNHSNDNYRRVVELIQSGAIGPVREVHVWVSRAWGRQPLEAAKKNESYSVLARERPTEIDPVPAGLDWELWLGPAPARPFNNVYFPGPKWYRWWDFGNGTMSDLGSHMNDLPFWALKLQAPRTVEAFGPPPHPEIAPASMHVTYEYGPRGDLPPVKLTWYQGEDKPEPYRDGTIPNSFKDGILFVGSKGMLLASHGQARAFARGPVPRLPAPGADDPELARPLGRVGSRRQDRRADRLELRVRRLADRGEPPGQRRLPRRPEDRVGPREALRPQRPRGPAVHPPRVPQGLDAGLSPVGGNYAKPIEKDLRNLFP